MQCSAYGDKDSAIKRYADIDVVQRACAPTHNGRADLYAALIAIALYSGSGTAAAIALAEIAVRCESFQPQLQWLWSQAYCGPGEHSSVRREAFSGI